jgi:hypothetical protein
MPIKQTVAGMTNRKSPFKRHSGRRLAPPANANREHLADASGAMGLPRESEMPKRGQLYGDSSQAPPLPGLGRLAPDAELRQRRHREPACDLHIGHVRNYVVIFDEANLWGAVRLSLASPPQPKVGGNGGRFTS